MSTQLPMDTNGHPIPALRLKSGASHSINVTAASARNTTPFDADTRVISLYATTDIYLNTGNAAVTATTSDHFFPAGTYYDISIGGGAQGHCTHIAVLRVSADGTLYISEKE